MKPNVKYLPVFVLMFLPVLFLVRCNDNGEDRKKNTDDIYDIDVLGIPQFVDVNYIELDSISQISRFRSGIGHDYSDDFESCRSMKHYFQPKNNTDWSTIKIFSPVNGTVSRIYEEWAGTQIQIESDEYPAFFFIIFHVSLSSALSVGNAVVAGQQLGTHIGPQTMSDIAVGVATPEGWKLISYFNVMTDLVFQSYQTRGLSSRNEIVIAEDTRDENPLSCNREVFIDSGSLENWVVLN